MKIRNQSLLFLLGVSSSESSSASSCIFAGSDDSFFFSPILICAGAVFFLERRISMKMHTASMSAQTMTTGIQILLMTLANPLLFDEREGNEPLPFLKFDGSKSPFWKLEGSKLPSPGVKEPEGFFESESELESESEELLPGLEGLAESESEELFPGLDGLSESESKSPLKPPGKLPEPPPGKSEESDD